MNATTATQRTHGGAVWSSRPLHPDWTTVRSSRPILDPIDRPRRSVPMQRRISLTAARLIAVTAIAWTGVAAAQNIAAPAYSVGETWTYNEINDYNRLQRGTLERAVIAAGGETTIVTRDATGAVVDQARLAGGTLREGSLNDRALGRLEPGLDLRPFPLAEGQRWKQTIQRADPRWNESRRVLVYGRVAGWESVRVPAGEFKAIKIVRDMYLGDHDPFRNETMRTETEWYVPELKMPVKLTVFEEYRPHRYAVVGAMQPGDRYTLELASFKRAN
jgi:hypothetical protein